MTDEAATGRAIERRLWLNGALAVGGAVAWLLLRDVISMQVALPLIAAAAFEALKSYKQWQSWREAHPGAERLPPARVRQLQQESVRMLADAARARAWFTRGIIACVTVPSVVQLVVGIDRAVAIGAVDPVPIREGEWWRLLSGTYLHGGLAHFFGNMGALLVFGSILESKDARLRLPLVYLLSCLGGSTLGVLVPPDVPSIGASGGVVGVIGYLFVLSRRQDTKFPAAFRGATASVFAGLFTMGALGFWFIDNAGHAGGALSGMILAGLLVDRARNFGDELGEPLVDLVGWLAAAVLVTGAWVTTAALIAAL